MSPRTRDVRAFIGAPANRSVAQYRIRPILPAARILTFTSPVRRGRAVRSVVLAIAAAREPIGGVARHVTVGNVGSATTSGEASWQRESVEAVFRRDRVPMIRLAAVVTGDVEAAADIVDEAYADLVATQGVREPAAWLRRAVTNRSRSWIRRTVSARTYLEHYGPSEAAGESNISTSDQVAARLDVRDALATLPPDQRAAVFLRYYLDLPEREIADALGCRPGTVKSRLARAMIRLQEHFDV